MNEARFSLIHFFIIMNIYLFHCEELYVTANLQLFVMSPTVMSLPEIYES